MSANRRGATLVLVAVMLVVCGGMAAFAIDFARVYSGVNELQTGADAAALQAAQRLMRVPATDPTSATVAFASSNSAFGSPVALSGSDVEPVFWTPGSPGTFTAASWANANAVRVSTSRSTSLSFSRFFGIATLSPRRRGIAWIGNQASRDCIKPWGIELSYVNGLMSNPITTQAGVEELRARASTPLGRQQLTIVAGPAVNNAPGNPRVAPTIFSALTGATSSRKEYLNALRDQTCGDGVADYTVNGVEQRRQPGQGGGDVARATVDGIEPVTSGNPNNRSPGTCDTPRANDATCFAPGSSTEGVDISLAIVTPTGVNTIDLNMLVSFRLICMFRGGNQPGSGSSAERCPWLQSIGLPDNNYVQGTIVGYPITSSAVTGAGNSLGNTIGTAQKLVLVQ